MVKELTVQEAKILLEAAMHENPISAEYDQYAEAYKRFCELGDKLGQKKCKDKMLSLDQRLKEIGLE